MVRYLKYYVVLFFLWSIVLINPSGFLLEDDEGAYLYVSSALAEGSSLYSETMAAKPPFIFILGSLIYKIFGNNIVAFRYIASLCGLVSAVFLFRIFVRKVGAPVATIISAMFLFDPLVFTQMRFFRTDIFMLTFIIGGLYFLSRERNFRNAIYSSLLFGISIYTRDDAILYVLLISVYFLYTENNRYIWIVLLTSLFFMILSFVQRGTASVLGSLYQQIPIEGTDIHNKVYIFYEFLKYLIETYPVWMVFPVLALFIIKIRRGNYSILASLLIIVNLIAMLISESHFIRYVLIVIIARVLLVSDLIRFINERYSLIMAISMFVLQLILNPPPFSELYYKEDSVLKISNYLKEVSKTGDVLLSDYGYFNFHSGLKGSSVSGYISGGSAKTGEIDSKRLIGVIEKEGVKYVLIHSNGRSYYPYGAEIYYYEPHHIRGMSDFDDFKRYIDTHFVLDKVFYVVGMVFELYKRE